MESEEEAAASKHKAEEGMEEKMNAAAAAAKKKLLEEDASALKENEEEARKEKESPVWKVCDCTSVQHARLIHAYSCTGGVSPLHKLNLASLRISPLTLSLPSLSSLLFSSFALHLFRKFSWATRAGPNQNDLTNCSTSSAVANMT